MLEQEQLTTLVAEEILHGKPHPHYLTGEMVISEDKLSLEATAKFPSEDITIKERGHVNVAHYLFGVWNAAHALAEVNGLQNTLSLDGTWEAHRISLPDQKMKLNVRIVDPEIHKQTVRGKIEAIYTINEEVYAKFNSSFIAKKKK